MVGRLHIDGASRRAETKTITPPYIITITLHYHYTTLHYHYTSLHYITITPPYIIFLCSKTTNQTKLLLCDCLKYLSIMLLQNPSHAKRDILRGRRRTIKRGLYTTFAAVHKFHISFYHNFGGPWFAPFCALYFEATCAMRREVRAVLLWVASVIYEEFIHGHPRISSLGGEQ